MALSSLSVQTDVNGFPRRDFLRDNKMPSMRATLLAIGVMFSLLAAASAYVISYHEYRQRMLRLDQDPRRMALGTAAVTFVFMVIAAVVLSIVLLPGTG